MEGLQTAALLERIALIAKLATSTDCDHDERGWSPFGLRKWP